MRVKRGCGVRTLNYTGRQRLKQADVSLAVIDGKDGKYFSASIDLTSVRDRITIPSDAKLVIEASNGVKFARYDHGTAATPIFNVTHSLHQFSIDETIGFRAKVVDVSGTLLALAENIRPMSTQKAHQHSLLPVSVQPLEDLVFRVDFTEDGPPTLVLNEALDSASEQGIKAFAKTPLFISLVFPNVVKEILTRFLIIDEFDETDEEEGGTFWSQKWVRFAKSLNPEVIPALSEGDTEPRLTWIETTVKALGRRLNVVQRCEQELAVNR